MWDVIIYTNHTSYKETGFDTEGDARKFLRDELRQNPLVTRGMVKKSRP